MNHKLNCEIKNSHQILSKYTKNKIISRRQIFIMHYLYSELNILLKIDDNYLPTEQYRSYPQIIVTQDYKFVSPLFHSTIDHM